MDQPSVESALVDLGLSAIRFFPTIDSTNDEARRWIDAGARHLALIVANEQTAGRGRSGRQWVTPPGAGLAFSLVLLSPPVKAWLLSRLTGLGAVAIQHTLESNFGLQAQIKWPNDVLLDGRKVAGVLVEAHWIGEDLHSAIIGIGINIAPESVSAVNLPAAGLNFPATCLEDVLGHAVSRLECLHAILEGLLSWLPRLSAPEFIQEWEARLAYRNQWVELSTESVSPGPHDGPIPANSVVGKLIGLTEEGSLQLLTPSGKLEMAAAGDIHLRPAPAGQPSLPLD